MYSCTKYPLLFIPLVCDKEEKSIHKALSAILAFQLAVALISPQRREKLKQNRMKQGKKKKLDKAFHPCFPDLGFLCRSSSDNPAPPESDSFLIPGLCSLPLLVLLIRMSCL